MSKEDELAEESSIELMLELPSRSVPMSKLSLFSLQNLTEVIFLHFSISCVKESRGSSLSYGVYATEKRAFSRPCVGFNPKYRFHVDPESPFHVN